MDSIILRCASKFLLGLILIMSAWVLLRGHNSPGGGFIAGLMTSSAFSLYLIAYGVEQLKKLIKLDFHYLLAIGLLCGLLSGAQSWIAGFPFFTSYWLKMNNLFLGTPLLFDISIYLVIVSSVLMITTAFESIN